MRTESATLGKRAAFGPRDRAEFSDEEDASIIRLILDGTTHRDTAAEINRSYRDVATRIVYLRREGLLPPTNSVHWKNRDQDKKRQRSVDLAVLANEPAPLTRADGAPVTMANVKQDGECKWPHGLPGAPDFRLCGHPAKGSWCDHHFGRVFPKRVVTAA